MKSVDGQYIELVGNIRNHGTKRSDRTGVGSIFLTGERIVSRGEFPIISAKKVNWQHAIAEILWMISGSTNVNDLIGPNGRMKIWDRNLADHVARYPDSGPEGDLGPIYGKQWRKFAGHIDQLSDLVCNLRTDPNSRRHMVTAFDPSTVHLAALPPCIPFFQVIHRDGELDMIVTQRSADCLLGLPFNLVQYAALQAMLAKLANMEVGHYYHNIGDAHLYNNHLASVDMMLMAPSDSCSYKLMIADRGQMQLTDFILSDFSVVSMRDAAKKYDDTTRPVFTGVIN